MLQLVCTENARTITCVCVCVGQRQHIIFYLHIRRKPLDYYYYYVVSLLPSLLLLCCCWSCIYRTSYNTEQHLLSQKSNCFAVLLQSVYAMFVSKFQVKVIEANADGEMWCNMCVTYSCRKFFRWTNCLYTVKRVFSCFQRTSPERTRERHWANSKRKLRLCYKCFCCLQWNVFRAILTAIRHLFRHVIYPPFCILLRP